MPLRHRSDPRRCGQSRVTTDLPELSRSLTHTGSLLLSLLPMSARVLLHLLWPRNRVMCVCLCWSGVFLRLRGPQSMATTVRGVTVSEVADVINFILIILLHYLPREKIARRGSKENKWFCNHEWSSVGQVISMIDLYFTFLLT